MRSLGQNRSRHTLPRFRYFHISIIRLRSREYNIVFAAYLFPARICLPCFFIRIGPRPCVRVFDSISSAACSAAGCGPLHSRAGDEHRFVLPINVLSRRYAPITYFRCCCCCLYTYIYIYIYIYIFIITKISLQAHQSVNGASFSTKRHFFRPHCI